MSAKYWCRSRKYSRARPAARLHFTRHPDDSVIRVALANRPAHDIILIPEGADDKALYHLVSDYSKALTRPELHHLHQ